MHDVANEAVLSIPPATCCKHQRLIVVIRHPVPVVVSHGVVIPCDMEDEELRCCFDLDLLEGAI